MAGKSIQVRLRPVVIAYLDELDRIGGFGEGRSAIVRRFVENGIARALKQGMLQKKNAGDLGEKIGDEADGE